MAKIGRIFIDVIYHKNYKTCIKQNMNIEATLS